MDLHPPRHFNQEKNFIICFSSAGPWLPRSPEEPLVFRVFLFVHFLTTEAGQSRRCCTAGIYSQRRWSVSTNQDASGETIHFDAGKMFARLGTVPVQSGCLECSHATTEPSYPDILLSSSLWDRNRKDPPTVDGTQSAKIIVCKNDFVQEGF